MMNIQFNELQFYLEEHKDKFLTGSKINDKKTGNVRKFYGIPTNDDILALIDGTVFGSAKKGLALTSSGLYWVNYTGSGAPSKLLWDNFAVIPISKSEKNIAFGENHILDIVLSYKIDLLIDALTQLQVEVNSIIGGESFVSSVVSEVAPTIEEEISEDIEPVYAPTGTVNLLPLIKDLSKLESEEKNANLPEFIKRKREELQQKYNDNNKIFFGKTYTQFLAESARQLKSSLYVAPGIPKKKLDNAKEAYASKVKEANIIALYDNTLFGSAKEGFILAEDGLYIGAKNTTAKIDFLKTTSIDHLNGYVYGVIENGKEETKTVPHIDKTALITFMRNIIRFREMENTLLEYEEGTTKRIGRINVTKLEDLRDYASSIGKYDTSLDAAQKLLDLSKNDAQVAKHTSKVLRMYGEDCYSKGYFDLAIQILDSAILLNPYDPESHQLRAVVKMERNEYEEAAGDLTNALPFVKNVHIYELLGYSQFTTRNIVTGIEYLSKAIELGSSKAEMFKYRADLFVQNQQMDAAILDLQKAIEINPADRASVKLLADLYYQAGNVSKAMEHYQMLPIIELTRDIQERMGKYYYDQKNWNEAVAYLSLAIDNGYDNKDLYLLRGKSYKNIESYQQAIDDLSLALSYQEPPAESYYVRGISYFEIGDFEKAKSDFKASIEFGVGGTEAEVYLEKVEQELKAQSEKVETEKREWLNNLNNAIDQSDLNTVETLIQKKSDLEIEDPSGLSVLMHAILRDNSHMASGLLNSANLKVKNALGYNAFEIAAIRKNTQVANQIFDKMYENPLIEKGAKFLVKMGKEGLKNKESVLSRARSQAKDSYQKDRIELELIEVRQQIRDFDYNQRKHQEERLEQKEVEREKAFEKAEQKYKHDVERYLKSLETKHPNQELEEIKQQIAMAEKEYNVSIKQLHNQLNQLEKQHLNEVKKIKSKYYQGLDHEKDEFETTAQYQRRMNKVKEKEVELEKLLSLSDHGEDLVYTIKNELEKLNLAYVQTKSKLEDEIEKDVSQQRLVFEENNKALLGELAKLEKANLDETAKTQLEISQKLELLASFILPPLSKINIGKYDADSQKFPITHGKVTKQLFVPIEKARQFKEEFADHKVSYKIEISFASNKPQATYKIMIQTSSGEDYTF
jgi:Flp pilus assembly protein TadD